MDTAELVRQIFLIMFGNSLCLTLLDRKYSLKNTLIIYGITTAAVIALGISIATLFGMGIFYSCYPIIVNGTMLVSLFFLSKRKGFTLVFTMLTVVMICTIVALPGYYLAQSMGWSIWTEILLKLIVGAPIILLLYRYLRPSYHQMLTVINRGWGYLCLIPGLYYALILPNIVFFAPILSENPRIFLTCMLALFIVIVSYGIIFAVYANLLREAAIRDEQQMLKIQMLSMERHANMLREGEKRAQIYRHDLSHYIADVKVLIESGNTEEALRALGSLTDRDQDISVPRYCDNATVNAILVYYIQKAENEGITVETDCKLPEKLPMEASELAMVLANAIENAINACGRLSKDSNRFITIKIVSSPQLALEISNSYTGHIMFDRNGLPISTQPGHGLGIKSIAAFVERHNGIIEYRADDSLFRLRLLVET